MKFRYLIKCIGLIYTYNRLWLFLSLVIHLCLGLMPIAVLWITKDLVNLASGFIQGESSNLNPLIVLIFLQLLVFALQSVIANLGQWLDEYGQNRMEYYLGKRISEKALSVPYAYFDNTEYHNHHARVSQNSSSRIMKPVTNILTIIQNFISLCSFIGFLYSIHWSLALLSLVAAVPILLVESKYGNARFGLMRYQTPAAREAHYTNELIHDRQGAKEIRLFNLGPFLLKKWGDLYKQNSKQMLRLIRKEKLSYVNLDIMTAILYAVATFISVWLLKRSKLNLGQFVVITQAVKGAQSSINMIASNMARIYGDQLYIEDLFKFLEFETTETNEKHTKTFPSTEEPDGIHIHNVSFKYPESNQYTLKNVNLKIKDGETIAIVGANGSGKTTLVKCLMGLYPSTAGAITFEGKDIMADGGKSIRNHTSVVFQDFMQYAYSIKDNIAFGDINQIDNIDRVREVGRLSGIETFVNAFPEKYETKLGKILASGEDLSGGQWQKIALARALFKNSKVIILDEPTASLDPETELEVYNQFEEMSKGKTTIYISHRMAAAKMADRIIVMKNGQLIEMGTHEELMRNGVEYKHMFQIQAKWYA